MCVVEPGAPVATDQRRRRRAAARPTKARPMMPTMPGSGTVVPPVLVEVDEVVEVLPPEVEEVEVEPPELEVEEVEVEDVEVDDDAVHMAAPIESPQLQ